MSMRIRTTALTALTVAALAAGTVLTAPAAGAAPKAAAPKFLSASQLPPHPTSSWTAGPVTEGLPEVLGLCVSTEGVLDYDYRHREFRTDLDTSAVQLTVVTGTAAQAKALAKHYDDLIRTCADRIEKSSPDIEAEGRDYGKLPVEEGARVRGLHTETSGRRRHRPAIGRAGRQDRDRRGLGTDGRLPERARGRLQEDHEHGRRQAVLTGRPPERAGAVLPPGGSEPAGRARSPSGLTPRSGTEPGSTSISDGDSPGPGQDPVRRGAEGEAVLLGLGRGAQQRRAALDGGRQASSTRRGAGRVRWLNQPSTTEPDG
jgi:hypothetical protein